MESNIPQCDAASEFHAKEVQVGPHVVEILVAESQIEKWRERLSAQVKVLERHPYLSVEQIRIVLQKWTDEGSTCDLTDEEKSFQAAKNEILENFLMRVLGFSPK